MFRVRQPTDARGLVTPRGCARALRRVALDVNRIVVSLPECGRKATAIGRPTWSSVWRRAEACPAIFDHPQLARPAGSLGPWPVDRSQTAVALIGNGAPGRSLVWLPCAGALTPGEQISRRPRGCLTGASPLRSGALRATLLRGDLSIDSQPVSSHPRLSDRP